MGLCKNLIRKKKRVRREVKMDMCPTVELGVLVAHLKKKRNWKKMKKMIAHGPSNKQYASKRWQTSQKGQRSWSRSMTFLSLSSSVDIAKCTVSMLKL